METGEPSRTAMMAASGRGWHLLRHGPRAVLADWMAWPFVGPGVEELINGLRAVFGDETGAQLSTWIAARSRIVEDWLAASPATQYVILGAGLDSYAWRTARNLSVLEIDHPATQAWKRSRLEALNIEVPPQLAWLPVDFEAESLREALDRSGAISGAAFVSWIGVTAYLTRDAIAATLDALPPCSLAVSYGPPPPTWEGEVLRVSTAFLAMAEASGEALLSYFRPEEMAALLGAHGFTVTEDLGTEDAEERFGHRAIANVGERVALAHKT